MVADTVLQNSSFYLKSSNVINVFIKMLSVVFPEVPGLLHSFFRKYLPNIHVEITIFCQRTFK